MQKRRGRGGRDAVLPVHEGDLRSSATTRSLKSGPLSRRIKRRSSRQKATRLLLTLLFLVAVMALCVYVGVSLRSGGEYAYDIYKRKKRTKKQGPKPKKHNDEPRKLHLSSVEKNELPLSNYSTLEYPLRNSHLVGLYFAASWCPMSTPVTEQLDEFFRDKLLPPPSSDVALATDKHSKVKERMRLSIVYVSSDRSEEELLKYQRINWISVPFDSEERPALKKQFSTCAKRELNELGIERKFEIPTLIILDGQTHGIITTNGAEDLKEYGEKALDHWLDLQRLVRALEEKYTAEER